MCLPFFSLPFFTLWFKDPLLRLRSGDKEACVLLSISKAISDEEYQSKDSGAGDNTEEFRDWKKLQYNIASKFV